MLATACLCFEQVRNEIQIPRRHEKKTLLCLLHVDPFNKHRKKKFIFPFTATKKTKKLFTKSLIKILSIGRAASAVCVYVWPLVIVSSMISAIKQTNKKWANDPDRKTEKKAKNEFRLSKVDKRAPKSTQRNVYIGFSVYSIFNIECY